MCAARTMQSTHGSSSSSEILSWLLSSCSRSGSWGSPSAVSLTLAAAGHLPVFSLCLLQFVPSMSLSRVHSGTAKHTAPANVNWVKKAPWDPTFTRLGGTGSAAACGAVNINFRFHTSRSCGNDTVPSNEDSNPGTFHLVHQDPSSSSPSSGTILAQVHGGHHISTVAWHLEMTPRNPSTCCPIVHAAWLSTRPRGFRGLHQLFCPQRAPVPPVFWTRLRSVHAALSRSLISRH